MTDTPSATQWKDWLPVLSLLLVIGGFLLTGGKTLAQVADSTRRIEALERRADERDVQLRDVQVKMAGMDGKLDLLLERSKAAAR